MLPGVIRRISKKESDVVNSFIPRVSKGPDMEVGRQSLNRVDTLLWTSSNLGTTWGDKFIVLLVCHVAYEDNFMFARRLSKYGPVSIHQVTPRWFLMVQVEETAHYIQNAFSFADLWSVSAALDGSHVSCHKVTHKATVLVLVTINRNWVAPTDFRPCNEF